MLLEVRIDRLVPQMNNIIDYMLLRTQVQILKEETMILFLKSNTQAFLDFLLRFIQDIFEALNSSMPVH